MAKFKDLAAPLIGLGIRVVPVKGKAPLLGEWQNLASADPSQVDKWSEAYPQATGVGVVSPEDCGYWVLDADDWDWLTEEMSARKVKPFKAPRVMSGGGRGVHFYFKGSRKHWMKSVKNPRFVSDAETPSEKKMLLEFPLHVVGPGSVHPKTGKAYQPSSPAEQWELSECPDDMLAFLHELCSIKKPESAPDLKPTGLRTGLSLEQMLDGTELKGKYKRRETADRVWLDYHKLLGRCLVKGSEHSEPENNRQSSFYYMKSDPSDWGHHCLSESCKCAEGGQRNAALKALGLRLSDVSVERWRRKFRTKSQLSQDPPVFVVDNFIPEGITGFGSIPGHMKTWVLLSVAKAVRNAPTKLWGRLLVRTRYEVLYITPETGDRQLNDRMGRLGLADDDGFLVRTMSMGRKLALDDRDLMDGANGKVVFLDTLVRFLDGREENSSKDIAALFQLINDLLSAGAIAVVFAHHSRKPGENFPFAMTQENVFRGSGDISANLAAGHGIYQLDCKTRDKSLIQIQNVKPRDFEPLAPFQLQGRPYIDKEHDFKMVKAPGVCQEFDAEKKAYDKESSPEAAKDDRRWHEALKMKREGSLHSEIAEKFGVSEKTSQRWCEEAEKAEEAAKKQSGIDFAERDQQQSEDM
jgi:hypothetical protein